MLETDYLVVGAGAAGMAFVDTSTAENAERLPREGSALEMSPV